MKRILQYYKRWRERRLRKYGVECAVEICQNSNWDFNYVIDQLHYYLTGPHNEEKRP